jgi:hypothetical protein
VERSHDPWKAGEVRGGDNADGEVSGFASVDALRPLHRLIDLTQEGAHIGKKDASRLGQRHLALRTVEQSQLELLFKVADPAAQRGLGHAQAPGRAAKVQFFAHRDEVSKVPQLHDS